jgi:adenylate kinase
VINNRISVYRAKTEPVIEYGRSAGVCHQVDGVGSIEDIFGRLCNHIETII